jgi:tail assembly chaperone E/41/14-like protein
VTNDRHEKGQNMDEKVRDQTIDEEAEIRSFESSEPEDRGDEEESNLEHKLSQPIRAHGEEVHFLRWREPTAGDIERAGNPIIVDFFGEKPTLTFNEKKMSAMISELCRIPPSSVRQLTAGDWNVIAWKLVRFFMPGRA